MRDYCTCLILTRHGNHISGSMDSLISLEYGPTMCQRFRQNGVRTSRRRMSRQKRDHWSSQCHQGSCGDFWRWKFSIAICRSYFFNPDILHHPCCRNGWFRFLNHFQHQQLEGPLTRRWATSRRVSAPPGGDMTGENDVGFTFDVSMWKGIREDVWLERCYCYRN